MGPCFKCQRWVAAAVPWPQPVEPPPPHWQCCSATGTPDGDAAEEPIGRAMVLNDRPYAGRGHLWTAPDFGCNQFVPRKGR